MQRVDIGFQIPQSVQEILAACPKYTVASNRQQLFELATRDAVNGVHEVAYDVPGRGRVVEATVCRVKNGIAANYVEPYMRRRDPECMLIADDQPTDKLRFEDEFGESFEALRAETFQEVSAGCFVEQVVATVVTFPHAATVWIDQLEGFLLHVAGGNAG